MSVDSFFKAQLVVVVGRNNHKMQRVSRININAGFGFGANVSLVNEMRCSYILLDKHLYFKFMGLDISESKKFVLCFELCKFSVVLSQGYCLLSSLIGWHRLNLCSANSEYNGDRIRLKCHKASNVYFCLYHLTLLLRLKLLEFDQWILLYCCLHICQMYQIYYNSSFCTDEMNLCELCHKMLHKCSIALESCSELYLYQT
ncbi:unnamed protein product [Moneuplotes crassus]|uniref:Uncharacterized protein n=1 Tax=Euplotes crassus TaxID=5936 RepID=A0AAD2D0E8_EUPCR|nr:unnamed protein product [Moneuplotes crassus]